MVLASGYFFRVLVRVWKLFSRINSTSSLCFSASSSARACLYLKLEADVCVFVVFFVFFSWISKYNLCLFGLKFIFKLVSFEATFGNWRQAQIFSSYLPWSCLSSSPKMSKSTTKGPKGTCAATSKPTEHNLLWVRENADKPPHSLYAHLLVYV